MFKFANDNRPPWGYIPPVNFGRNIPDEFFRTMLEARACRDFHYNAGHLHSHIFDLTQAEYFAYLHFSPVFGEHHVPWNPELPTMVSATALQWRLLMFFWGFLETDAEIQLPTLQDDRPFWQRIKEPLPH